MHANDLLTIPFGDPVMIMLTVLTAILIMPLVARLTRLPEIVGLIGIGILVGPHGFNLLAYDQTMRIWGTIGLLYIMFLAGLEIDAREFVRFRHRAILFGGLSFLLPQVVGALAGRGIFGFSWTTSILLASMFASYTLISYPIVSRLKLVRMQSVTVTVGGTLITDTLALLVLAVIAESVRHELTLGFAVRLTAGTLIFLMLVLWGVPRLSRWFFKLVGQAGASQFLFVLVVLFGCAALSGLAGIEPIIGAFLAGFTLNRMVLPQRPLGNRIQFVGKALFIPFFLLSVGMIVDPRAFAADPLAWSIALYMTAMVILTKYAAAVVARRLLGYSPEEGCVMFGLSVTQAAATLAAVMVGFELEIFDASILNGTILMILSTCLIGPWVTEHYGRILALRQNEASPGEDDAVAGHGGRRILVPLANPETAERMLDVAFLLREEGAEDPVYPLHVVPDREGAFSDVAMSERMLMQSAAYGAATDIPVSPLIRVALHAGDGIRRAVTELRADTVVLGWTPRSTTRDVLFGGLLDSILDLSGARVVLARVSIALNMLNRVVLVVPPHADRERGFVESVRMTFRLAERMGAAMTVCLPRSDIPAMEAVIQAVKPSLPVRMEPHHDWRRLRRAILQRGSPGDLLVLLSARRGGLSWQPNLRRLPMEFSARHPETAMLTIFAPGLSVTGPDVAAVPVDESRRAFSNGMPPFGVVRARMDGRDPSEILNTLLSDYVGERSIDGDDIRRQLLAIATQYPIELTPGTLLLHAHCRQVDSPVLFLATMKTPLPVSLDAAPARLLMVLLSPVDLPPTQHLRNLGALVRTMGSPGVIERLIAAEDDAALRAVLPEEVLEGEAPGASPAPSAIQGS